MRSNEYDRGGISLLERTRNIGAVVAVTQPPVADNDIRWSGIRLGSGFPAARGSADLVTQVIQVTCTRFPSKLVVFHYQYIHHTQLSRIRRIP